MEPEEKRHNIEDNDTQDPISGSKTGSSPGTPPNPPKNSPKKPKDAFTKALKEMEDRLTANMNNMKSMIEPLQTSIDTLLGSQAEWESHKQKVTQLEEERKVLNQRVSEVEKKNATLETRIKKLENKLMECNIIVHGVKEVAWESDSTRRELVVQTLADTVKGTEDKKLEIARRIPLTSTKWLGRYNPLKPRPIYISFACKSDVDMLLEQKKSLKPGIYVDREYSAEDEAIRRKLRPILWAARQHENYKGKCKMEGTSLIIKGKKYSLHNLHELPDELSTFNISSQTSDKVIGFFGELNPLSNFHPSKFTYNGNNYHCSEQMIQHMKALYFKDTKTASIIMNCTTALECKIKAKGIANYNHEEWTQNAINLCEDGLAAKFDQNYKLKHLLQSTGTKKLVECCKDKVWGNGLPLSDNNCLDPKYWDSQGILGEMLEKIWNRLSATLEINMEVTWTVCIGLNVIYWDIAYMLVCHDRHKWITNVTWKL